MEFCLNQQKFPVRIETDCHSVPPPQKKKIPISTQSPPLSNPPPPNLFLFLNNNKWKHKQICRQQINIPNQMTNHACGDSVWHGGKHSSERERRRRKKEKEKKKEKTLPNAFLKSLLLLLAVCQEFSRNWHSYLATDSRDTNPSFIACRRGESAHWMLCTHAKDWAKSTWHEHKNWWRNQTAIHLVLEMTPRKRQHDCWAGFKELRRRFQPFPAQSFLF